MTFHAHPRNRYTTRHRTDDGQVKRHLILPLVVVLLLGVGLGRTAAAQEVDVPVTFDALFLRQLLLESIFKDAGGTARIWDDGTGCNYLVLSEPLVELQEGRVRILSRGRARVATALGSTCLTLLDWDGQLETFEEAILDRRRLAVEFRVVESNLYDRNGEKRLLTGTLWDWVKGHVHPRLEAIRIDLRPVFDEVRGFLPLVLDRADTERVERVVHSLTLTATEVSPDGLVTRLRFDLPERRPAPEPYPEPTLTTDEVDRWEASWQRWDAFLVFTLKQAATDTAGEDLRRELLAVLLDSRHELLAALRPPEPGAPDPVPGLFLSAWTRLAPLLRQVSDRLPLRDALRYSSFVAAADALRAIEELGPDLGVEISADGLRRLARIVAPAETRDPLEYSVDVDPELRRLFGFDPPLDPAGSLSEEVLSFWVAPAHALTLDPAALRQLEGWAPAREDLPVYLPLVRRVLQESTRNSIDSGKIREPYQETFRVLVLATAWQETCWRQFVRKAGQVVPIRSAAGSVGLMQVNENVWRGFYDIARLRREILYNGRAGTEILRHYFVDYAVAKGEDRVTGNVDNLARATYAAFNGGPGHLSRYRRSNTSRTLRQIDAAFWEKYRVVQSGDELAVARCYGD